MATPRRNRRRQPGRQPPFRDPKPVVLVLCEGEVTEPEYLQGLAKNRKNPRVQIDVAAVHGDPRTLVQAAKKRKADSESKALRQGDDNLAFDSVWCVFDIDQHSYISDAKQIALENGIHVAVSNPCFELWLLLHFRDQPGMQSTSRMRTLLFDYVSQYDKRVDYKHYAAGYQNAVVRAKRLDETAENDGEPGRNPTTSVYKLAELI
jgi:hypothetical protein